MENSQSYSDLLESGIRKKKKKNMQRGENSYYDADKAQSAYAKASSQAASDMSRKMKVKWGKKNAS